MNVLRSLPVLLLAGLVSAAALAQPAQWWLMSRHGECTGVQRALQHKFGDLPTIAGPTEFAAEMNRRGLSARVTNAYGGNRDAVLIEVPQREVSLLFVRKELCREYISPR